MKIGHVDIDPRIIKNDEADVEELNYKVARKLKKELAPELSVKQFNKKIQEQVHNESEGRGKREKKAKVYTDFL